MDFRAAIVIYDANVLFPFHTGHLLSWIAFERLVQAHWTADIEHEWVERSIATYGEDSRAGIEARRDAMNRAMPDAKIDGYQAHIADIKFTDPDDRHVIAAAMEAGASLIVTRDRKFFERAKLDPYDLQAIDPDDLLCGLLEAVPELFLDVLEQARASLRNSAPNWTGYIDSLEKTGLLRLATKLRAHFPYHHSAPP
jgi:predicted nucleic acid-binding protein